MYVYSQAYYFQNHLKERERESVCVCVCVSTTYINHALCASVLLRAFIMYTKKPQGLESKITIQIE